MATFGRNALGDPTLSALALLWPRALGRRRRSKTGSLGARSREGRLEFDATHGGRDRGFVGRDNRKLLQGRLALGLGQCFFNYPAILT